MTTTTKKQTPSQARTSAQQSQLTPLYAVAGLTDAVAGSARSAAEEVGKLLRSLPEQARALPQSTKVQITTARKRAGDIRVEATTTYDDLAGRGKKVVGDTLVSARRLSDRVEKRAEGVLAEVAERVDPALERVQESVTVARKTVTGRVATETVTSRAAAQAAAHRAAASSAEEAHREARRAAAKKAAATRAAKKAAGAQLR